MLRYQIQLDVVARHDDGQFLWFHPRVAAIPGLGRGEAPAVIMTLQKHLGASDHYSGLYVMRTDDLGRTWTGPDAVPQLDWSSEGTVDVAVCDVTPGYHAPTGKILAIGAQVRYNKAGAQLEDREHAHQTAYAVYDPKGRKWTKWKPLKMPPEEKFNYARNACAQWLVKSDGSLLLPFYFGRSATVPMSATVVQCSFDGTEIKYVRHGTELHLDEDRGLAEPSIVWFAGRYYLTIRSDARGYVTVSEDGLRFGPMKPWAFDNGDELGSYNTQQHWLAHADGLFLVYTRQGADNDHIMRHRAPLFIARVDPATLAVIRKTERILVPERGATLGNFGASAVSERESWVTVAEGIWNDAARKRGATGAVFVAKVIWPNAKSVDIDAMGKKGSR